MATTTTLYFTRGAVRSDCLRFPQAQRLHRPTQPTSTNTCGRGKSRSHRTGLVGQPKTLKWAVSGGQQFYEGEETYLGAGPCLLARFSSSSCHGRRAQRVRRRRRNDMMMAYGCAVVGHGRTGRGDLSPCILFFPSRSTMNRLVFLR